MPGPNPRWMCSSSQFATQANKKRRDRLALMRLLRSQLAVLAIYAAGAMAMHGQIPGCPLPWYGATTVYGTMGIQVGASTSDGSGGTATTDEDDLVDFKMINPYPTSSPCVWGTANFGVMGGLIAVNDTEKNQAQCFYGSMVGNGPPVGGTEQYVEITSIDAQTFYLLVANSGVNVLETEQGTCPGGGTGTLNTSTGWGFEGHPSGPGFSFTPSPVLEGSGMVSSYPSSGWGTVPIDFNVDWKISVVPADDCEPCKDQRGSELGIQSQSLGENIPIVGTPFYLHYESNRQPGSAGADVVAVRDSRMMGGWTLNVHHAFEQLLLSWCIDGSCTPYAVVPKALYLGDGSSRNDSAVQSAVVYNGNTYLTSEDGSEVYAFKNFRHVQTLRPLTGAVLYDFAYDSAGNLESVTDANGNRTTIHRDGSGHPTEIVSPYGQVTKLTVDSNGYLIEVTDPAGHAIRLSTAASGLLVRFTDANDNTYKFDYDEYSRVLKDSDPAGGSLTLSRTDGTNSYSVSEKTALGVTGNFEMQFSSVPGASSTQKFTNTWPEGLKATKTDLQSYGELSESVALPDGYSSMTTYGPDPRWGIQTPIASAETIKQGTLTLHGSATREAKLSKSGGPFDLVTQTDTDTVNGRTTRSVFTSADRTYVATSPMGRGFTTIFDNHERVFSTQAAGLAPTQFNYDSRGRVSSIAQETRVTSFSYNSDGYLASITGPLGIETKFTYDDDGNMLSDTLGDGRVIHFKYDAGGNLTSLTPPGKSAHELSYSPVSLMSGYTPPATAGAGATSYTHNEDRDLTSIVRPDGKTILYGYDSAGRLESVTTPTETIQYAYDAKTGSLDSESISGSEELAFAYNGPMPIEEKWSGEVNGEIEDRYDDNFWIASESVKDGETIDFAYDNDGLLTKAGPLTLSRSAQNGLIEGSKLSATADSLTYDSFGELTSYTASSGGKALYAASYSYDAGGRISSRSETVGGKSNSYVYSYDKSGRLVGVAQNGKETSSYTYDSNSNRTSVQSGAKTLTATYDSQDRMLTYGNAHYFYTANGELASAAAGAQTTKYEYDVFGNLLAVSLPTGKSITYLVDAENHRVGKKAGSALVEGFLYDGDLLIAQLDGSNHVASQFVYATGSTSPDFMISGGETYRIFSDSLGGPRLVVNASTGAIAEEITYDELGNVISDTRPGFQPFGFAGGLYDQDTKLLRFGARDYDPRTGRWTAKDPILFAGGDSNLYGYVLNDPVNRLDPTGLDGEDCTCAKASKSIHFATGFVDQYGDDLLIPVLGPWPLVLHVATGTSMLSTVGEGVRSATGDNSIDSNSDAYVEGRVAAGIVETIASAFAGLLRGAVGEGSVALRQSAYEAEVAKGRAIPRCKPGAYKGGGRWSGRPKL